jgi:hypothetical protein
MSPLYEPAHAGSQSGIRKVSYLTHDRSSLGNGARSKWLLLRVSSDGYDKMCSGARCKVTATIDGTNAGRQLQKTA